MTVIRPRGTGCYRWDKTRSMPGPGVSRAVIYRRQYRAPCPRAYNRGQCMPPPPPPPPRACARARPPPPDRLGRARPAHAPARPRRCARRHCRRQAPMDATQRLARGVWVKRGLGNGWLLGGGGQCGQVGGSEHWPARLGTDIWPAAQGQGVHAVPKYPGSIPGSFNTPFFFFVLILIC